ncbi:unnamed protein product, partial [marine sediment metagenome]
GLSNRAVINAVKTLEAKNIIIANRRIDKEKGNLPTTYSLNILPPYEKSSQGGSEETSQGLMKKVHTQNTVLQNIDNNVNVTQYPQKHIKKSKAAFFTGLIKKMVEETN